jgi:hypothetical protein
MDHTGFGSIEGIISNVIRATGATNSVHPSLEHSLLNLRWAFCNKENKVSEYEEELQRTWQAPSSLNCGMVLLTHNC